MKRFIIFLLLPVLLNAQAQTLIKTTPTCTQEMADEASGKWMKSDEFDRLDIGSEYITASGKQEAVKRMQAVQQLIVETDPAPMGADGYWHISLGTDFFAPVITFSKNDVNEWAEDYGNNKQIPTIKYVGGLFKFSCKSDHEIAAVIISDVTTSVAQVEITANSLNSMAWGVASGDPDYTINGRPILTKQPAMNTWKGFDLCAPGDGGFDQHNERMVLISRNGALPYIPVTRKQYLDLAIHHYIDFFKNQLGYLDAIPDQQEREQQKESATQFKNKILNHYQDELAKTTANGKLNDPAVLNIGMFDMSDEPVFTTEDKGGRMLVIANADYMHKELPKYIPQFFVLHWQWTNESAAMKFKKAFEENFPVEKLQALIDK